MINKTKKYWTGDSIEDISEYLRIYSEDENINVKPIICHSCGNNSFELNIDQIEGAIQVICTSCGTKKILLDCDEIWEDARPKIRKCPVCKKSKSNNVSVGFIYRDCGFVKWVYIGNRCTKCNTLGSCLDWKIDYGPTDEMEANI